MKDFYEYSGFKAKIYFSYEDSCLFGKIVDIDDVVIFEISNPEKAYDIFKIVVDDYISLKSSRKDNKDKKKIIE